jgi:hypothetical protein
MQKRSGCISTPRRAAIAAIAAVLLTGLACGKNRVVLNVDVRSFMDESELVHPYDSPPLVPSTYRLAPREIDLIEGFTDFGAAQSATLDVGVDYENVTGQGPGTFVIYFSDDPATLYDSPPVAFVNTDLQPGTTTPGETLIQADARVLDLFTHRRFYMGVEMTWTPQGTQPLQGTLDITRIQVRMISTLEIFN